jgi:hypothetical protein
LQATAQHAPPMQSAVPPPQVSGVALQTQTLFRQVGVVPAHNPPQSPAAWHWPPTQVWPPLHVPHVPLQPSEPQALPVHCFWQA